MTHELEIVGVEGRERQSWGIGGARSDADAEAGDSLGLASGLLARMTVGIS